jgi:hypothetical protein
MGLFGSISKALFGKKKPQTSESGNQFADQINDQFSPMAAYGAKGMGQYANILGLGGEGAQDDALGNWWDSSGGDFMMNQGMDQIVGNRAAGGLLRSGGTSKAIEDYRSGLASSKLGEYMGLLGNMNQQALGAGNLVANAGQYSKGTGAQTTGGGLGKAIGLAMNVASLFSDRRLKRDIRRVGELHDGLGVYRYRYLWEDDERVGVMADEVADLRPWALGPEIEGFRTVNYHMLDAA